MATTKIKHTVMMNSVDPAIAVAASPSTPPQAASASTGVVPAADTNKDATSKIITKECHLGQLFDKFHNQIQRIENLEAKIDARATQTRRRITNLIEYPAGKRYASRNSHLRLFVTHEVREKIRDKPDPKMGAVDPTKLPPQQEYRVHIEGKLLVGHLDHESAIEYDQHSGFKPPNDDLDRSKGEKDEEEDMYPIKFTHFFDKMRVEFEPLFQPKPNPMSKKIKPKTPSSSSGKKKSRRGSSTMPAKPAADVVQEEEIDPSMLVRGPKTSMEWRREMTNDANGWQCCYIQPSPPGHHLMLHSIVAYIKLYSRKVDDIYQANLNLSNALFPSHGPDQTEPPSTGSSSKKRKADDMSSGNDASSSLPPPPMETSITIPQGLTMKEYVLAFFQYVHDKKLCDENDKSIVVCDPTLKELMGVESFPFHQLQQLLVTRNLLANITGEPIALVYPMKLETATSTTKLTTKTTTTTTVPPNTTAAPGSIAPTVAPTPITKTITTSVATRIPEAGDSEHYTLLQLDMDVVVPALFPFRTRELLRRIKRRELEYTSSRTKGRYILMSRRAKNEDVVKSMIDAVVQRHSIHQDLQPVLAALAKAAPPNAEARMASHYDLRISYLLERLHEYQSAAQAAWALAGACCKSRNGEINKAKNARWGRSESIGT